MNEILIEQGDRKVYKQQLTFPLLGGLLLFQQQNPLQPALPVPDPDSYPLDTDNEQSVLKQHRDLHILAPKYVNSTEFYRILH